LQVAEAYVRARLAMRRRGGELTWYNEAAAAIRNQAGEELVRPDGALRLAHGEATLFCLLEMDRGATHWPAKVEFYEAAWQRGDGWQAQFHSPSLPPILGIVPAAILDRAGRAIAQEARHSRFLLKPWPAFLASDFLDGWLDVVAGRPVSLLALEASDDF
jgi:hypothetical protein